MDIGVDVSTQLFPNPLTMLYTLCVTGIMFFFVYKFLFGPAREVIAKRADYVQSKLTDADNTNAEAKKHLENAKAEVEKAQDLSKEIIERAKEEAVGVKDSIVKDANEKADDIYRKAHERIQKEEVELKRDINRQIVDVALAASEKLITETEIDAQTTRSIEAFVEELNDDESN